MPANRTYTTDVLPVPLPAAPTVSVLLPVYNGRRYLRSTLDSIAGQIFRDFELIIIDDGSSDGSLTILAEYARRDPRIRLISRRNTGIAGALNEAISMARGTLLARIDADDICFADRFEKQVDYMNAHPKCVLLGGRVLLIDPFGVPQYESNHKSDHEQIVSEFNDGVGWAVLHPAAMMRADAVRAVGGYRMDCVPAEDLDLFLRLVEVGRASNLQELVIQYRQHPQSANHTRFKEQRVKVAAILKEAFARRGQPKPPDWAPEIREVMPLADEIRMWGWGALGRKKIDAARRHSLSLLKLAPFSPESWKLLYCAVRGW